MASVCVRFCSILNGLDEAERLAHKDRFGDLVRELGYLAPMSRLVPARTQVARVEELLADAFDAGDALFCKPLDGFMGRGACEQPDRAAAVRFLCGQKRDYLAQSLERPVEDWRYIVHRARGDLERPGDGPVWRIAYKKVRPHVVGDGTATVERLAGERQRRYARRLPEAERGRVPAAGERVDLIATGNISQGAVGLLPPPHELAAMDAFFTPFLAALEERLGGPLGVACLDVGVKDPQALADPACVDRLREQVVFYEFQVPFGLSGYVAEMPVPARRASLPLPRSLHGFVWRRRTALRFLASLASSGRYLSAAATEGARS